MHRKTFAWMLVVALLSWAFSASLFVGVARAASLTGVKDTLTTSDLNVTANHVVSYTSVTAATAGQTIKIQFDPAGDAFNLGTLAFADISTTGMTLTAACSAAASEVTVAIDNAAPDENATFTVCAGDTVAAGAKTVTFSNNRITNPNVTGSYVIRIAGTQTDLADTRVAIIDKVTMTASVDTSLTFTIAGVAAGQAINGDAVTTSAGATATALSFGTLTPGTAKVLGQTLSVTTNARNGFVVTVQQDQNLLSATGADIDLFKDASAVAVPTGWTAPLGTLDVENTYGHYGVTSEDADLNADEFATALYAGDITTARQVFSHTGPADGTTTNKGQTRVGIKIEINALQEAATDYTNSLVHIATPTF